MLKSTRTQHLEVPGGTLAFDDTGGTGPLVIAAPGMGDVRGVYRFVVPELADAGYRVVTMDVRGHGETSTGWPEHTPEAVGEDLLALVRHLNAGPATLIGVSFTPASVVWAAAQAPELVSGIVLIAPFASTPKLSPILKLLSLAILHSPRLWSDFFYKSLYPTAPPDDLRHYRAALRRNLREPGRMAALRAMAAAPKEPANRRVPEVECPMLVLMGSKDPDFKDPEAEARLMAEGARDATVTMIDDAGHYPPAEHPERTLAALLPFLDRVRDGHRAA